MRRFRVFLIGDNHACPSRSRVLLEYATQTLAEEGAETTEWNVAEAALPPAGIAGDDQRREEFRRLAQGADALVLVTPVHNSSFSGLLKNAIDHLDHELVRAKPVGLMASCGGQLGSQALDHLRVVVRSLHAVAIPSQVIATEQDFIRVEDGFELTNPQMYERIGQFAAELLWFVERLNAGLDGAGNGRRQDGERPVMRPAPWRDPSAAADPVRGTMCEPITRAISFMRAHFDDADLSLDTVAREAFMSRYHFSRTFHEQTGRRFIDYLTMLRLSEARSRLALTDEPITVICYGVGYRDLSHFERTFKRWFNVSPSEYRNRRTAASRARSDGLAS